MKKCPHCYTEIKIKELPRQGFFDNYRICPECGGFFTVDRDTKYRQALFIIVALISLAFTMLLYFGENIWLLPAILSYLALAILLYWGNKKIYYVPYNKPKSEKDI